MGSAVANAAVPARISAPPRPNSVAASDQPPLAITGTRKAAILLTSLDDETSAAILRQLPEKEVHEIVRGIGALSSVTEAERQAVLAEYINSLEEGGAPGAGGVEYATSVLIAAFGEEAGRRLAGRALQSMTREDEGTAALRNADPQHLARLVQQENPQTIAILLAHLGGEHAARLIAEFPPALRVQVARRLAALDRISPDLGDRIANVIGGKLRVFGGSAKESYGGVRALADILNRVNGPAGEELLSGISSEDAALGDNIRNMMFVFGDFEKVSKESMRTLLARVDRKVLVVALKGAAPALKAQFTSLMSSGAVEMLNEDMQALGPVRIKDVEEAQQKVIATARQLEAEGQLSLTSASADEYVE